MLVAIDSLTRIARTLCAMNGAAPFIRSMLSAIPRGPKLMLAVAAIVLSKLCVKFVRPCVFTCARLRALAQRGLAQFIRV